MDRISGGGYIIVGGVRVFQDQNLAAGINGTDVVATWLTGAQESIILAVVAAGLTPTDSDNTQLMQAIETLPHGRFLAVSSFGGPYDATFTPNPLTKGAWIFAMGGGGSAGGTQATSSGQVAMGQGGGGASWALAYWYNPVVCEIHVGAGGAWVASPGGLAGANGDMTWINAATSIGGTAAANSLTVYGGHGGAVGVPQSAPVGVNCAAGGEMPVSGSGITIVTRAKGETGAPGFAPSASLLVGCKGGGSPLGDGGQVGFGIGAGAPGTGNGCGGSGGAAAQSQSSLLIGGQPGNGLLIIIEQS